MYRTALTSHWGTYYLELESHMCFSTAVHSWKRIGNNLVAIIGYHFVPKYKQFLSITIKYNRSLYVGDGGVAVTFT